MTLSSNNVIVIGAGFGGLAAGIRLQAAGKQVTIVEALDQPGGRAGCLHEQGFTFDMGPTLITAPHLLQDLWESTGGRLEDDLDLIRLEPYYRIFFPDGAYFDCGSDEVAIEREIARFNPADVPGFRAFLAATRELYSRAFVDLARKPFHELSSFLAIVPELVKLGAIRSVYSYTSQFIQDPRLRTIFSFHPLFIGGSPLRASAIYSIIPYLERLGGVHFARGGMTALVNALVNRFESLGGTLRLRSPVTRIGVQDGRIRGVELGDGSRLVSNIVVSNADATRTYMELLPSHVRKPLNRARYRAYQHSMSCYLIYLGLSRQYAQLRHHTVIMPDRYQEMIREVFDGQGLPNELALYVHAPTRTDPSLAPPGGESLYILAPVPHLGHGINWAKADQPFRDRIMNYLEHNFGLEDLERSIVVERRFNPTDFATRLRSWQGAAFSIEPTLLQSAYFRPHNRQSEVPGLYLVGAGTHPGAGLPGTLLSAEITSGLILGSELSGPQH
ncbi:MAG: phytoene desaturase family protein [Chloroflexota bacterium]